MNPELAVRETDARLASRIACTNLNTARVHLRRLAESTEDVDLRHAYRNAVAGLGGIIRELEEAGA